MQIHEIQATHKNKKSRQVGRGGKRGKTSGRGTKGQKARAGHKLRPDIRDAIKKLPKLRGYRYGAVGERQVVVNVGRINSAFESGETVTPRSLVEKSLVRVRKGARPEIKILSLGTVDRKFTVENCSISAAAREKIEKAGGKVV